MRVHLAWRRLLACVLVVPAGLTACLLIAGCGQGLGPAATTVSAEPSSTTAATAVPTSTSQQTADVEEVFSSLAEASQPMTIFGPTFLPAGTALADQWLPVLEFTNPQAYDGPPVGNPQVLGSAADSEIQVVFQAGDGWLAILENFRGDLGDVTGTPVGTIAGNVATLYRVNGGELVQWSQDGLWYGVFGRGVPRDDLLAVARGMKPVPA